MGDLAKIQTRKKAARLVNPIALVVQDCNHLLYVVSKWVGHVQYISEETVELQ